MLRNYLKMALKVLARRKFYTFISMFGICITLTIFLVVYAFWEHSVGAQAPESKLDRSLFITNVQTKYKNGGGGNNPVSFYFLDRYVSKLKTPEQMTFYSIFTTVNTYVNNKKVTMDQKYTDAAFWEVMEFNFLEGRPYQKEEVLQAQRVAVLNREVKEQIFGKESAIGKAIELYQEKYTIVGVVENVSFSRIHTYASIYLPYTLSKDDRSKLQYNGQYMGSIVAKSPEHRKEVQTEFDAMMKQIENPEPDKIESIEIHADPYLASFTRMVLGDNEDSGVAKAYTVLGLLLFLFMLLPTINLMNINISRIMERASEIGVRKAFGAASSSLVLQFVLENLILTLFCGFLSLGLAYITLEAINEAGLITHSSLALNMQVFWAGLLVTLLFGLVSGVYPAWRMSRLQAAEALKIS